MGTRGPKANPKSKRNTTPTGVRLDPQLRTQLERAARKNGQSLSREMEERLSGSFLRLDKRAEEFGDMTTYAFCRLMAIALRDLKRDAGHPWHRNRWVYDRARTAINTLLDLFRPDGKSILPDDVPVLEAFKDALSPSAAKRWRRQFEESPMGETAARRAVLMMEAMTDEGGDRSPYLEQFRELGKLLMPRLLKADGRGKALAGLQSAPKPDWGF
jgi:hypothetical protein